MGRIVAITSLVIAASAGIQAAQTEGVKLEPVVSNVTIEVTDLPLKDTISLLSNSRGITMRFAENVPDYMKNTLVSANFKNARVQDVLAFVLTSAGGLTHRVVDPKTVEILIKRGRRQESEGLRALLLRHRVADRDDR